VRTMSGERLAENLAQQRDEREREAYRRDLAEKEESREGQAQTPTQVST
jgi:hypothetical protein